MRTHTVALSLLLAVSWTGAAKSDDTHEYGPLVSSLSTSTATAGGVATIEWTISSSVDVVTKVSVEAEKALGPAGHEEARIYRYTYSFENTSPIPVRLNLSDPHVANSPLTAILDDFSFTLAPRQKRTVQFLARRDPEFIESPVNNAIWTEGEWGTLGTTPASLYIPAWTGSYFVEAR